MYFVNVRDKLAIRWIPCLLLACPQPHLYVEELYFQVASLSVSRGMREEGIRRRREGGR